MLRKQNIDIKLSIQYMNIVNDISGSKFHFQKSLDIYRTGGYTPAEPEAFFWDDELNQGAVIEIKSFAYAPDEESSKLLHKIGTIHAWMVKHLKDKQLVSDQYIKYICVLTIHKESFNPNFIIKDLEKIVDLFIGYSSEYVSVELYGLSEGESIVDLGISFNELEGEDLYFIHKYSKEWELESAIGIAMNYDLFSSRLMNEWINKDWSKKFKNYSSLKKILFIDVDFRSPLGIAFITGAFQLSEFVAFFADQNIIKYPILFGVVNELYFKAEDQIIQLKLLDTIQNIIP